MIRPSRRRIATELERTFFVEKTTPPKGSTQAPPADPNATPPAESNQTLPAELPQVPTPPASVFDEKECTRRYAKCLRVGWIIWEELYLEPAASLAAVQRMAKDCGVFLPLSPRSLGKCLDAKGLLVCRDKHRTEFVDHMRLPRTLGMTGS